MKNPAPLVRACFVLGGITDGLAVVPMMFPRIGAALFGGDVSRLGTEYRYAMSIGASLMTGWTFLLIWGAIRPVERRGILILTIFPVVTGIVCAMIYGIQQHVIELHRTVPLLAHLSVLSILYVYAYVRAGLEEQ